MPWLIPLSRDRSRASPGLERRRGLLEELELPDAFEYQCAGHGFLSEYGRR